MAMKPERKVNRRSFIARVTGGLAGFSSLAIASKAAGAVQQTDSDRYIADQPGAGRGPISGITDQDPADSVGNGRGNTRRRGDLNPERPPESPFRDPQANNRHAESGVTDSDPTDPAGDGQARPVGPPRQSPYDDNQRNNRHAESGYSDSDPTDPVGDGRNRGGSGQSSRRCTDSDGGPSADRSGEGRHC
ncbi:MAG TPA: hypothetical protein VIT38_17450 [Allosphingosinicella sp.]